MTISRVLVFSTDDHLFPAGGAEQAFGHIASRMPEVQFDLVCARLRRGALRYEEVGNITIHRLGFGIPKLDGFILALYGHQYAKKLLKQHSYNFIWSIMASYGAFAAVQVKRATGLPFLLTLQEGDSLEYIYRKVRFVRKKFDAIFQTADAVQAISTYLLNWAKNMGYRGRYGRVIPNGVAVSAFAHEYSQEARYQIRQMFGFSQTATVLFTSSRLEPKNGIGDVITALVALPPEVCFVICGSGSLEVSLRQQVTELGLDERVKFMGFVDPSELPRLMQASDIFIRPSLSEGLGNAFLEAMASGIVTVGTNVGGIPDFLTDGETGFMVGKEDPESIATVITHIRHLNEADVTEITSRARALVLSTYTWEVVTTAMRELMDDITQK